MSEKVPIDILNFLYYRFIDSVPLRKTATIMKLCMQIEKSYWFYMDNIRKENNGLPNIPFEKYAGEIFKLPSLWINLPHLRNWDTTETVLNEYKEYKNKLPTYGAILLTADLMYVLLVQTYDAKGLWGFPKGKIEDENEEPHHCAIREVLEETNYDISRFIKRDWYVEDTWENSTLKGFTGLYIVPNVSMQTKFKARTSKEIRDIKWFKLSDLLAAKNGLFANTTLRITANAFYMKNRLQSFLFRSQYIDQYGSLLNRRQQQYKFSNVKFNGRSNSHWKDRKIQSQPINSNFRLD